MRIRIGCSGSKALRFYRHPLGTPRTPSRIQHGNAHTGWAIDPRCRGRNQGRARSSRLICRCRARVFTAYRMQRAMEHAEHTSLSAAVIDISRGGGHPAALCRHLAKRRVPFAFYGRHIPAELREWAHVPLLAKPAAVNSALDVVARLLYLSDAAPATIGRAQRNAVDCGGIRPG